MLHPSARLLWMSAGTDRPTVAEVWEPPNVLPVVYVARRAVSVWKKGTQSVGMMRVTRSTIYKRNSHPTEGLEAGIKKLRLDRQDTNQHKVRGSIESSTKLSGIIIHNGSTGASELGRRLRHEFNARIWYAIVNSTRGLSCRRRRTWILAFPMPTDRNKPTEFDIPKVFL